METILSLVPLLLIGGMLYLLIITLRDAFRLKGSERIAWVCLIIFIFPLGSIIFLFAKPNKEL